MRIGDRIKIRREELGITQTELALSIHSTKQTIYKYENSIVTNIPSDKIELLAQALHTTPAYLMGWAENESFDKNKSLRKDTDPYKSQLDDCYNRLNDSGKKEACRRISELTEIPRYIAPQDEEQTSKLAIVAMGGDGVKFIKTTKEADEEVKRILKEMWEEDENK